MSPLSHLLIPSSCSRRGRGVDPDGSSTEHDEGAEDESNGSTARTANSHFPTSPPDISLRPPTASSTRPASASSSHRTASSSGGGSAGGAAGGLQRGVSARGRVRPVSAGRALRVAAVAAAMGDLDEDEVGFGKGWSGLE
jgi:hypothetical protein